MKAKILGKALTLLAALALFANTSAWGAGSASPTSVMVPVGGSVAVTITNNDSNNRTLRIGSTGSSALGTWSNTSLSATLSSTSVSSGRTTTLTITGLKANDSSQTISIYRTGNTTVWCTITVSKVVVPIEKTVAVGDTLTFNSTAQVTSRYYYQFASADTSSVTATPASATRNTQYSDQNVSLSVTGVKVTTSPVLVTLQQRSGSSGDFSPVELYGVTVRDLPQETRAATLDGGSTLTVSASDLDGTIASVRSDDDSVATVTLAGGVATITGTGIGSTTVRIRTATTEYAYTITVNAPTIYLCVGDVVKFNYDFGATSYGCQQAGDGSIVGVTAANQGASTGTNNRRYQSAVLTVTAKAVGSQTVKLQRRTYNSGWGSYSDYDAINVVVLPARTIKKGETTNYVCKASMMSTGGSATWTALAYNPTGIVNAQYGTCTATSGAVTMTGTKRGTTTVTAKNVQGTQNTYWAGLEYALAITVTQDAVVGEPVTVYEGESVTLADASTEKDWTAASLNANTARVTASGAAGTGAVITGVKAGSTTVEVDQGDVYYSYAVTVLEKPVVNLDTIFVCVGSEATLAADKIGGKAWRNAATEHPARATAVSTSGAAGTGVRVRGVAAGETLLTVETADAIYQAHVRVSEKQPVDLGTVQVKLGGTLALDDNRIAGVWRNAASADPAKVSIVGATTGAARRGPIVLGEAETDDTGVIVTFEDDDHIYTAHVLVFDRLRYNGGSRTVVPPPKDPTLSNFEAPALIPVDILWGDDYTVTIDDLTVATFEQTADGIVVHGLPQGTRGDVSTESHVGTQDNGAVTTLRVANDDAVFTYTIYVVSDEVHEVKFCEGDKTQIWYNDTTGSSVWYLLVNDDRYELDQKAEGPQISVTLTAQSDVISYIIATAERPGDPDHGDLVVISDGVKYYTYRMSCSPARVVAVGESTNMVCRTVAVNNWRVDYMSDQWGYTNYIDVVCNPDESGEKSHFTTATITGLAIADETYVLVRDDLHKAEEHNAQGAVYTLKTRVTGCPVIPVMISAGVTADVSWENWVDPTVAVTVEAEGDAGAVAATLVEAEGERFQLRLTAADAATAGASVTYTVKAGNTALAKYVCTVAPTFAVAEGTTAPGYLYGVKDTPWECVSLHPDVATVAPTKYNRLYSAEAKFLQEGLAEFHSTNPYYQAGYYFVRATVYDTHVTDVDLLEGGSTNLTVVHHGNYTGDWSWSCDNPDLVDVALTPDSDPFKMGVAITAKDGVKGAANVTVSSPYHQETIRVYVSPDDGKTRKRVNGTVTLFLGATQSLPTESTGGSAWTATSMNTGLVTVTPSGAADVPPAITGVAASALGLDGKSTSQTTVVVESDSSVYIYTVNVVTPTTESVDMGVLNVGETRVMQIRDGMFDGDVISITPMDGSLTVEGVYDPDERTNTITGRQEGETTLVVKTTTKTYYLHVTVRTNHIDKHIQLAFGADGTRLTYSYTFDQLTDMSPDYVPSFNVTTNADGSILYARKNGRYSVLREGNKVTFVPGDIEVLDDTQNTVVFLGQVDGLAFDTQLHYWVKIVKAPEGERMLQKDGQPGYITYRGTDDVRVDPETGDVILVFTNANEVGNFTVPAPWNVKMDILAIGGGGAGGSTVRYGLGGGGGGAGGFTLVSNRVLTAGSFGVKVGKGAESTTSLIGTGVQGLNGDPSVITNAFKYAIAEAAGGGGGGALGQFPESINGMDGGSGGGASWNNRSAGVAGSAEGGQGYAGGTPQVQGAGGGGGGAGGAGGSTGSAGRGGAGRTSDITGETVTYAVGGAGGRNDMQGAGAAGAGPGYGGEGGSGAAGGAGADGVVIVRIKSIYRNVKVPIPGTENVETEGDEGTKILVQTKMVTPKFVWTEWKDKEEDCVSFEYEGKEFRSSTDAKPHHWDDAVQSLTGTTAVRCYEGFNLVGEPVKEGVGYYSFTLRLNEGYAWEDGLGPDTYGDTSPKVYRWAVVEDDSVTTASINIHKTVEWSSTSNATVTVTTFTSPEMSGGKIPNVLFLGGLCNAHGYSYDVITTAVNTVTKVANLDYYFFNGKQDDISTEPDYSGSLEKGETLTQRIGLDTSNHGAMTGFSEYCWKASNGELPHETYDYIIFSFDRTLVATYATSSNVHERAIAEWLKPYYDSNSVIWLVDVADNKGASTNATLSGSTTVATYPWAPSPLLKVHFTSTSSSDYWSSLYYWDMNWGSGDTTSANSWMQYKAMMSLFDPDFYLSDGFNKTLYDSNYQTDKNATSFTPSKVQALTGTAIENQVRYDDPSAVSEIIANVIKVKPYNLNLRDKIKHGDSGLTLNSVSIWGCVKGDGQTASTDENDWVELMRWHMDTSTMEWMDRDHVLGVPGGTMQVYAESNLVTAVLSNVDITVWTKVKIGIDDDGHFRTTEDAYYNQFSGKWEKNPNEGMAFAEMMDNLGNALNIEGEAETETPWSFDTYTIRTIVRNGEAFVQGRNQLEMGIGEGNNCTVYYRPYGGNMLTRIVVDGKELVDLSTNQAHYTFQDVRADHEIRIEYEPFVTSVESAPVTNVYDGAVHFFDVTAGFVTNALGQVVDHPETQVRFAPMDVATNDVLAADIENWMTAEDFAETYGYNLPPWSPDEYADVGDHEIAYRVYAKQYGYGETFLDEGWVWVQFAGDGSDHSVILPRPLIVRPNDSELIYSTNDLPHIDFYFTGFAADEDLALIDEEYVTNGWFVTSTYTKGMGMGLYDTWVRNEEFERLWDGDPAFLAPDAFDPENRIFNFGNYYLVNQKNGQAVEKLPIDIGGVPQMPGLDPEGEFAETGVDPAVKLYDGLPTNLVVNVTSINPSNETQMVIGEDYTITYALADPSDPTHPTTPCTFEETQRLHAGTNVVWYWVEPIGLMTNVYFAASNYNYVVVEPRRLVLESGTAAKKFDGTPLSLDQVWEVTAESDGLATGDTLTAGTTAEILHVGSTANVFNWALSGTCQPGDYLVETRYGTLTVTPRYMKIGEEDYDPEGREDDPDYPGIYWHSGVEDAVKVYDGIGTNIIVSVTVPEDAQRFRITYSTNYEAEVWSETNPVFTNVCDQAVWFRVEAIGEWAKDYVAVTNLARVIITPREATVTANAATATKGVNEQPPYTATVAGDFAAKDVGHEYELIHWDAITCTNFTDCVKAEGTYPDVIVPTGVITQGNYAVTYYPGTLTVVAGPVLYSLWITDHADAGNGYVHLQFEPTFSKPLEESLTSWMTRAANAHRIWVFFGNAPTDIESVTTDDTDHAVEATLRATNPVDETTGRVWITAEERLPTLNRASKIIILGE